MSDQWPKAGRSSRPGADRACVGLKEKYGICMGCILRITQICESLSWPLVLFHFVAK